MEIFETPLPGVGVRYEFVTGRGRRLGILVHRDGQRELLVYDKDDEDSCRDVIELGHEESAGLVELLGGTKITEHLADLHHQVQGLSIEWITLGVAAPLANRTIGDGRIRTVTGASVVAVLRSGASHPGPGPDFILLPGDVVLVTGTIDGVEAAREIIAG
jgi:TrkA domain protein